MQTEENKEMGAGARAEWQPQGEREGVRAKVPLFLHPVLHIHLLLPALPRATDFDTPVARCNIATCAVTGGAVAGGVMVRQVALM